METPFNLRLFYTISNLESSRSPSISSHFDVEKHERALEASNIKKNFPVQIKVEPESEISIEFESVGNI